jgi:hypothetical protein
MDLPPRGASLPRPGLSADNQPDTALSLNQDRCADIDHRQWYPLAPALRRFATARMRTAVAQEVRFGAQHRRRQGGICSGTTNVWIRLHHAQPDAQPVARLVTLMSESGMAHATIAHRLYGAEEDWLKSATPASANCGAEGRRKVLELFEASQRGAEAEMGLARQPRLDRLDHRTGDEVAASILCHEGYTELVVQLETKESRQPSGHSMVTFNPGGNRPVTICDANLGEFVVAPANLQDFLRAWAATYGAPPPREGAEAHTVLDIAVYPVLVRGDIAATPLASLGGDIRAAGQPADLGEHSPEGSPTRASA